MADQIRVNIKHAVNASAIRREKRNGRDVIVVPSATLPDDCVMNRIKYPSAVIEDGYKTFERTHAPLGHPRVNNAYVPAADPEAIAGFGVGAWNENVRRENGRVYMDKVIDVEMATSLERGRTLLEAINKQKPIHSSTGLLLEVDEVEAEDHDRVATKMLGDHDCFLLNEEGASTPAQGTGIFVNSTGEQIEVVNSELVLNEDSDAEQAMRFAFEMIERDEQRGKYNGMISKVMTYMKELLSGGDTTPAVNSTQATGLTVNSDTSQEIDMTPEELKAALDEQATNMQANFKQELADTVKPLQEQITALNAASTAAAEKEKQEAIAEVVNAKLLSQEEAEGMPLVALNALANTTRKAPGLATGLHQNRSDKVEFEAPEAI